MIKILFKLQRPLLRVGHRCTCGNTSRKYGDTRQETTVNPNEVNFFRQISNHWWDPTGELKALHSFNTLRVTLIRQSLVQTMDIPTGVRDSSTPFNDLRILDIGCGGGILSEPLARLGACVVGLDPAEECIKVAKEHASKEESLFSNLTYICDTAENHLITNRGQYDAVIASEVAEHVNNLQRFVKTCIKLTKVQGSIFMTTINRTYLSWLMAILIAENVLRIVPKGTHRYEKLVPPQELEHMLNTNGCQVRRLHGMVYNPVGDKWHWVRNTSMNYAVHAVKVEDKEDI